MVGDIQSLANLYPVCHFFYFQKNQFKEREAYMKYIELFWNRLYYCIFNCDKKTQILLNRFIIGTSGTSLTTADGSSHRDNIIVWVWREHDNLLSNPTPWLYSRWWSWSSCQWYGYQIEFLHTFC